jgi:ADP-ribose pyrophosphatase YjhB (NUDIX family)
MLHLIPPVLHRALYRLAHQARKNWLQLVGGQVYGCTIIARDGNGHVLLVRHSYGSRQWAFPGGGMKPDEDVLAAATREFAEELRCGLIDPLHLGTLDKTFHGARHIAHAVTGLAHGEPNPDMREVVEARFFARDALPDGTSRSVGVWLELLPL